MRRYFKPDARPVMPSAKKSGLSEEDVNHVVSYLRSLADNNAVTQTDSSQGIKDSVLLFESSYSLEETIENIKQAALGYNFRYIREQILDKGFVDKEQETILSTMSPLYIEHSYSQKYPELSRIFQRWEKDIWAIIARTCHGN